MNASNHRKRLFAAGATAAIVLGAASTAAIAAATGGPSGSAHLGGADSEAGCRVPPLAGATVDVELSDMGAMMGGPHGGGPMMNDSQWWQHMPMRGMMRLAVDRLNVRSGTVSLRAFNVGAWRHEVVVLPLRAGKDAGERPIGTDGKVSETGSLGEASRTCGPGEGHPMGIAPGKAGWITMNLKPGRYELICNLPGHYAAGMYAELDVTR